MQVSRSQRCERHLPVDLIIFQELIQVATMLERGRSSRVQPEAALAQYPDTPYSRVPQKDNPGQLSRFIRCCHIQHTLADVSCPLPKWTSTQVVDPKQCHRSVRVPTQQGKLQETGPQGQEM